jgi:predicted transcriptional regulator
MGLPTESWASDIGLSFKTHRQLVERLDAIAIKHRLSRAALLRKITEEAVAAEERQTTPVVVTHC